MRIQLAENTSPDSSAPQLLAYTAHGSSSTFTKASYVTAGYTKYEVICIGAAGGAGGSYYYEQYNDGTNSWGQIGMGGGGGGGGIHRVTGTLASLAATT